MSEQKKNNYSGHHEQLFRFLRSYLLFIAIACGSVIFCFFHFIPAFSVFKPAAYYFSDNVLPLLIFLMRRCRCDRRSSWRKRSLDSYGYIDR